MIQGPITGPMAKDINALLALEQTAFLRARMAGSILMRDAALAEAQSHGETLSATAFPHRVCPDFPPRSQLA